MERSDFCCCILRENKVLWKWIWNWFTCWKCYIYIHIHIYNSMLPKLTFLWDGNLYKYDERINKFVPRNMGNRVISTIFWTNKGVIYFFLIHLLYLVPLFILSFKICIDSFVLHSVLFWLLNFKASIICLKDMCVPK